MTDDLHARLDELVDTDPLRLRDEAFALLRRAETSEAAIERLKARHQPRPAIQLIRCERHSKSWSGNHEMFKDCPDCREEQIQVCSNITCCGWPCDDFLALDAPTEGAPDAG